MPRKGKEREGREKEREAAEERREEEQSASSTVSDSNPKIPNFKNHGLGSTLKLPLNPLIPKARSMIKRCWGLIWMTNMRNLLIWYFH